MKELPLGAPATDVVLGPDGTAFALTPSTGTIYLIDSALGVTKSQRLAGNLSGMCVSPDGESVLAIAPESRELIVVEAKSLRVADRHKLSAEPETLAVPPPPQKGEGAKPRYVAISSGQRGAIELIDYGTGQRWHRDLDSDIGTLRFRADGQRLLAAKLKDKCISALSVPELDPIADLPVAMKPENLCFNADQGQLFVSGPGMDAVAIVFPYNPLDVDQTILAGRDPGVMACSENPAFLFVGSSTGSDVCILNIDSRKLIGVVDTGQQPTYITVTPDSQYALVLSESAGTMAVIHIPDVLSNAGNPAKWRNKVTASLFTLLPVASRPLRAAVISRKA